MDVIHNGVVFLRIAEDPITQLSTPPALHDARPAFPAVGTRGILVEIFNKLQDDVTSDDPHYYTKDIATLCKLINN